MATSALAIWVSYFMIKNAADRELLRAFLVIGIIYVLRTIFNVIYVYNDYGFFDHSMFGDIVLQVLVDFIMDMAQIYIVMV